MKEREFLDVAVESNPHSIVVIDINKTILVYNKKSERLFGFTKEEMLGAKNSEKIIPLKYRELYNDTIKILFEDEKINNAVINIEGTNKKNVPFPIRIYFEIAKDKKFIVMSIVDVIKEKEQEMMMLYQNRSVQMGQTLSMIAHQWRQPLNIISVNVSDLIFKIMLNNFDKHYFKNKLEAISNLINFLSNTIDEFRSFYKKENKEQKVLLSDVVQECIDIILPSLKYEKIELNTDFNNKIKVPVYKSEIKQVIIDLIKNSKEVLIEEKIKKPEIYIKTYDKNNCSYIEIRDNGRGIDENIIDQIFDAYFSTKFKKDGTGLGLYIAKIIIEKHHNGKLSFKNGKKGAIFTIKICKKKVEDV